MEEKIINIDEIEKKTKRIYMKFAWGTAITFGLINIFWFRVDYIGFPFFLALVLFSSHLANYFLLRKIKCPNCEKNYFIPFLASKDDMKKLTKSNPNCINCNEKAKIISEYQTMY